MQAGKLDQRITFSRPARVQNAFGEATDTGPYFDADSGQWISPEDYVADETVWASVRQQGASERQRNGITTTDNTYAIRIRWQQNANAPDEPFVDSSFVITYRGRRLAITSVVEAGQGNREWIDILAVESK